MGSVDSLYVRESIRNINSATTSCFDAAQPSTTIPRISILLIPQTLAIQPQPAVEGNGARLKAAREGLASRCRAARGPDGASAPRATNDGLTSRIDNRGAEGQRCDHDLQ
jgi:hypothetical protein